MEQELRVETIEIENIQAIPYIKFSPGTFTIIEGDNGTGKSTILRALTAVFRKGHDPDLVRHGAEFGRVNVTLSNGTVLTVRITKDKSKPDAKNIPGVGRAGAAREFIAELVSGFSFDPLSFITAKSAERLQFFLEAMGVLFTQEEIKAITGTAPKSALDLRQLAELRASIFESRTAVNGTRKRLDSSIATHRGLLPEGDDDGVDYAARLQEEQAKQSALTRDLDSTKSAIYMAAETKKSAARAEYEQKLRTIDQGAMDEEREATKQINEDLQVAAARVQEARTNASNQRKYSDIRAQIAGFEKEAEQANFDALIMTAKLEQLDELREERLKDSPLPGVTIEGDRIIVDGTDFDHLNDQRKYEMAITISTLKRGPLGFLVADRSESIVGQQWNDFQEACKNCGLQIVVARPVADAPLRVVADGQVVASIK